MVRVVLTDEREVEIRFDPSETLEVTPLPADLNEVVTLTLRGRCRAKVLGPSDCLWGDGPDAPSGVFYPAAAVNPALEERIVQRVVMRVLAQLYEDSKRSRS